MAPSGLTDPPRLSSRRPRFVYLSASTGADVIAGHRIGRVGWRVLAANNRPLARSPEIYPSLALCRDAVALLHRRRGDLGPTVLFDSGAGTWSWSLHLSNRPVAVCAHPYLRRIECTRAMQQFLGCVADGPPVEEQIRHLGIRALAGYDAPAV
jgi:uncharacterized protein YegP (UPF0339 family)